MTRSCLPICIAVLVGCWREPADAARPAAYVEVFRLAQQNMVRYQRPRLFCLAREMSGEEGEDSLVVAAVKDVEPRARPLNSCVISLDGDPATVALRPSPDQYLVWLKEVARPGANTVVFHGGYSASGLLAAEWRCEVKRDGSGWRVVDECRMLWFS